MTAILRELDAAWHAGDCAGAVALAASYWRSLAPRDADRVARYLLEQGAPPTTRSHGEGAVRLSVEIRLGLLPAGHPARLGLVGPLVESLAAWDDLPGAAEAARTALDQDGERASAAARAGLLTQLGRLYAARSDTTAAREWLVRALAEPLDDRHHGYTLATLQQLEADVGRPREAARLARRRLRASDSLRRAPTPADGQLLADLACLLRDAGEPAEALPLVARARGIVGAPTRHTRYLALDLLFLDAELCQQLGQPIDDRLALAQAWLQPEDRTHAARLAHLLESM